MLSTERAEDDGGGCGLWVVNRDGEAVVDAEVAREMRGRWKGEREVWEGERRVLVEWEEREEGRVREVEWRMREAVRRPVGSDLPGRRGARKGVARGYGEDGSLRRKSSSGAIC